MTRRKPPIELSPLSPQPKTVAYPPADIWKTKEEGVDFAFRGNLFVRRGNLVSRVTEVPVADSNTSGR